jgi:Protein of unknown function (DUF1631)
MTTSGERAVRRPLPKEMARILGDCRDLAIHRLLLSFTSMLDRVGDLLMARAERSDVREEQALCLDARSVLNNEGAKLIADFERHLRQLVDDRFNGKVAVKADFAAVDAKKLTLIETSTMDESVLSGNIVRIVENQCESELRDFNRAVGYLLGRPDLETAANPLAPTTIVEAFTDALHGIPGDQRLKLAILKELNQTSLGDINEIYADLNRHLDSLKVVPKQRAAIVNRGGGAAERGAAASAASEAKGHTGAAAPPSGGDIDLMAVLQRLANSGILRASTGPMPAGGQSAGGAPFGSLGSASAAAGYALHVPAQGGNAGGGGYNMPAGGVSGGGYSMPAGGMGSGPGTMGGVPAIGPFGGPRILVTPELGDALGRLQHGETGFEFAGAPVQFAGLQQDMHNVLRDIQESPIGSKANQLEAMTIELVAMLFDFIFETKDLPDSIKALVGRLQIPVLKAAMLDGAFFSKKSHPSRLLVNALAHAGIGWSPTMGHDDPLYRKIETIVHRVLDDFTDDIGLFDTLREDLEAFLATEEKTAEVNIQSTAEQINQRDRQEIAQIVARSEIDRRLKQHTAPNFLATFLREKWQNTLVQLYLQDGEESEAWSSALSTLDDLVWSVQPKRATDDRKKLVAMLRNLLRRLHGGLHNVAWEPGEREQFMSNLVAAHAAAVKSSLSTTPMPTTAVSEAAAAAAVEASAKGDLDAANKALALAEAMAPAPAPPEPEPEIEIPQDRFAEIAGSLERGMWVEFEGEDGQLAFAKLAWVSPLRGTYLFTNRQGQKAVSLTADELAERFRNDRARLVEAEPLIDRAFTSMMATIEQKFGSEAVTQAN